MKLDRKAFLLRSVAGAAGLAIGAPLRMHGAGKLPDFDERDPEAFWQAVRGEYSLSPELTYFNTGGLGPAARRVIGVAEKTVVRLQEKSEHGHALFADAREEIARFLGAAAAEIAFVRNATEANAIVAAGLALTAGDEVIFESHAHPGGSFPWLNQQRLRGVVVKVFEPDAHDPAGNVRRIAELVTPRTRVVQVSHVTAPTGIVMPVAEIAAWCRARGIWFHIDGAQSAGMFPFSLHELGCDSFATSGHKWLGAPHGTGVLFVRRDRLDDVTPVMVGAYSGDVDALPGELRFVPTAERFEYGTRDVARVLGLVEAARFQERIGRERIAVHGRMLASRVRAGLESVSEIEILTPQDPRACASMITFRSARVPFEPLFNRLLSEHALRCRPVSEQGLNAVRVSTHVFNSPAECDALVAAVEKIVRPA